jgi:ribosomal protein L7/L12
MDKFHLAHLISFVQHLAYNQRVFEADDIAQIDKIICNGMPQQPIQNYNDRALSDMLTAMKDGRKIDAIRHHRAMSGFGLKESKDFIEQHWITQKEVDKS